MHRVFRYFAAAGGAIFIFLMVAQTDTGAVLDSAPGREPGSVLGEFEAAEAEGPAFRAPDAYLPPAPLLKLAPEKSAVYADFTSKALAAAVIDGRSGELLFAHNAGEVRSVASITKLAAALTFLDFNPGWEKSCRIRPGDSQVGGGSRLYAGETLTVKDLFYASLVGSDNGAARALARAAGMETAEFVAAMNEKVAAIGLAYTRFADPVGLSAGNISTAEEIGRLAYAAFGEEPIREATLTAEYGFMTGEGRAVRIRNTDALLRDFPSNGIMLLGGKTGYTGAAGYCFAAKFADSGGNSLITVVLGAGSAGGRFSETKALADWAFSSFEWP